MLHWMQKLPCLVDNMCASEIWVSLIELHVGRLAVTQPIRVALSLLRRRRETLTFRRLLSLLVITFLLRDRKQNVTLVSADSFQFGLYWVERGISNLLTMFFNHLGTGFAGFPSAAAAPSCVSDVGSTACAGTGSGTAFSSKSFRNGALYVPAFIPASSHLTFTTALGINPNSLNVFPFHFLSSFLYSTLGGLV